MSSNLLVVDWDYFFVATTGDPSKDMWLFDWGHHEGNILFYEALWPTRAEAFWRNGLEIPTCNDEWRMLWDKVKWSKDGPLFFFADSNMQAVHDDVFNAYDEVWLLDAHHDCGYGRAPTDDRYSCENWMLAYEKHAGSKLIWLPPAWETDAVQANGPGFAKDLRIVNSMHDAPEFDTVFVCRSGCWTPPWEDQHFMEFITAGPWDEINGLDPEGHPYPADKPRNWDEAQARATEQQTMEWFKQQQQGRS